MQACQAAGGVGVRVDRTRLTVVLVAAVVTSPANAFRGRVAPGRGLRGEVTLRARGWADGVLVKVCLALCAGAAV